MQVAGAFRRGWAHGFRHKIKPCPAGESRARLGAHDARSTGAGYWYFWQSTVA